MTDIMAGVPNTEDADETHPAGLGGLDEQLINQLVGRAKAGGLKLTNEGEEMGIGLTLRKSAPLHSGCRGPGASQ